MNIKKGMGLLLATLVLVTSIPPVSAVDSSTDYYNATIKSGSLGNYNFEIEAHEKPSHETLPIVSKDYFPKTVANFSTEIDNTSPSAVYKAKALTKVDVVFAVGQHEQLESFQAYIPTFTAMLTQASNSVDARVEQIKTEAVDMQNAFNWVTDVNSSIGSISIQSNGTRVQMYGNPSLPGTNAMWVTSDQPLLKQTFKFDYSLNFGDSFDGAGLLFNLGQYGGSIRGYALFLGRGGATIGEFDWTIGRHPENFPMRSITSFPLTTSGTLEVTMSKNSVTVSGGGANKTVSLNTFYGFGLGFFSDHYSHGCDSIGQFALSNITLKKTEAKGLGDAISDVAWRDNAVRFIVHITDIVPNDLINESTSDYAYTVTKLMDSNAYLINLGTYTNQSVLNKLLTKITGTDLEVKGTFIYNNQPSIASALNNTSTWILNKVKGLAKPTDYILVNQQIAWETEYKDSERDIPLNFGEHTGVKNSDIADLTFASKYGVSTGLMNKYTDDKILAEKWRYSHNPTYYDNSTVTESYSKVWISDPVTVFQNPGLFRINYKRRDNPISGAQISDPFDNYRYWSTDYDRRVVTQG